MEIISNYGSYLLISGCILGSSWPGGLEQMT